MNPSYNNGSSPNLQRPHPHPQHPYPSLKSPLPTTAQQPNSPASGRQRARTESSPRHQHTPSGWLGPYHEQPSPAPTKSSPRSSKPQGGHSSTVVPDHGVGTGAAGGLGSLTGASDRILETHRALGGLRTDGGSSSNSSTHVLGGSDGAGFERKEFDPKINDIGLGLPPMESCTSLQSLVESIDDDHVLRLTEMTKKRVEYNNPGQKRQRVVSLPAVEANFQPSEKTLQFSNSCKTYLESRYTQLYQSINAGRPINRLRRLHEIFPQIKPISAPKPEGKASLDLAHSRSRRWKNDKYRFVDKVEESSCIWDVDHMEAKAAAQAAAQAAAEAAVFAKHSIVASSRHGSQHHLEGVASPSPHSSTPHLPSASTESLGVMNVSSGGAIPPPSVFGHPLQCDSPLAVVGTNGVSMGLSPSSTFSSVTNSHHVNDSTTNSSSSLDRFSPMHQKEALGESKLRFGEVHPFSLPAPGHSTLPIKSVDSGISSNVPEPASIAMEPPPSRRNSIFGIFSMRGKKGGQDGDPLYTHQEVPQLPSHDNLQPTATTTQERRSFDSNPPPKPNLFNPNRRRLSVMEFASWHPFSSAPANTNTMATNTQPFHRTSEEGARTGEYSDVGNGTDDEYGGHFAPPSQWPQGERTEESQDESDPATAASKRSSLRRFKERMTWKRGTKTLSVIQQGEPFRTNSQSIGSGKQINIDGNKSLGKKVDPVLASLRGVNSGRASISEPSSGRNSMENSSRPKQSNFRILSSTSSPVLEAVKNPDGVGIGSPRVGPIAIGADGRMDRSSTVNLSRNDKSSMANPSSTTERSPIMNAIRTEKSPTLVAESMFSADNPSGNVTTTHPLQLLVDVDRIPKRLLQRLKARPELSSINWTADTVDLSALWTSPDPPPTYEEHVGISDAMKASKFYPSHLDDIDVLEIHLTLGVEESRDFDAKNRANRWDMLELRIDQELAREEKWLKEVSDWSRSKVKAIARHQQAEIMKNGGARMLDESAPLMEEPEAEGDADEAAADATVEAAGGDDTKNRPHTTPRETLRARKLREMSLLSVRDLSGSMSSLHTSVTYTFKASVETTREAVKEMSGYLEECRQRLKQLNDATGERLQTQEPVFQEIVEQFSREWNETYFVMLKDVEDQIQVMNSKRVENPWMDVLLIILSWFIRGVFYMVEGVTIMIIIVRHAWGKAKKGFNAVRHPTIANEPGSPTQMSTDVKGR